MMTKKYDLILVDGSSYLFRAYHATAKANMVTSAGEPTGAIRTVISMLHKLINTYQPKQMAVIFDAKGKNFRHELFADYKANRPPMPDELRVQIEPLHDIIRALGLPLIVVDGVEADDVLGTYAKQAAAEKTSLLISTGDKDLAQLVNEHVTLINTMNDTLMDVDKVKEKFGVDTSQIIDYLALIGDTSDNIPGVPKVGPKTAVKWLAKYENLDNIIAKADEFGGKVGENLRASLEQLPISYQLATIKCDVELDTAINDLVQGEPDKDTLQDFYSRFEFKAWLKELQNPDANKAADTSNVNAQPSSQDVSQKAERPPYVCIQDQASLDQWLGYLQSANIFAFDTETTSLNYIDAEIVGVSFATAEQGAAYVPLAHSYEEAETQLDRDRVLQQLKPLLESEDKKVVGQHLKYDKNVLQNYNISLTGIAHDTMLESYVFDSTATRHDMDSLASKYLGEKTIKFEEVAGKGAKQVTFDKVDIAIATDYAAEDADITLRLHQALHSQLAEIEPLHAVYNDIELPLIEVLSSMETTGVLIDADMLYEQSTELAQLMAAAEIKAHDLAGEAFNLGSPKQIQGILFEKQGLPVIRKTPKGQPSTAEDVLQELADAGHEIPQAILHYRSLSKLKSTYTDKLPQQMNSKTGRVHTSYHQAVAATGRLSSSDPNLQNIPIRTEEGRRIRQAFVAPQGYKILAADYSQIELRIMAHLSGDDALLRAFANGEDIHKATAAEVFAGSLDEVTDEQRRSAKAINFGLIYGMSAFGLAKQLGITRGQAQSYVDLYFERYPSVKAYMDNTREQAKEKGYVETVFGRRLYLPDINARNGQMRQYAERTAINAPMQGTAADIIKKAMLSVYQWLQTEQTGVRMVMQVHDELVFEVPEDSIEQSGAKIKSLMENAAEISVPLLVEVGVGVNWDEAH